MISPSASFKLSLLCIASLSFTGQAAIVITGVNTSLDSASSATYTVAGGGSAAFSENDQFTVNYGRTGDLRLTGFTAGGNQFNVSNALPTTVQLRRNTVNAPTIPGDHQIIWYRATASDYSSGTTRNVEASYTPSLSSALGGNIINRGTDNMFQNTGDGNGNHNNIERVDFLFTDNLLVPRNQAQLNGVGFSILERGANDPFFIAAILAVDSNGLPSQFASPVAVATSDWGNSPLWARNTLVVRATSENGSYLPSANVTDQSVHGLFFSLQNLGVQADQVVYGYSLFAGDTIVTSLDELYDWTDAQIFPTNTSSASGGLDLVSGGSGVIVTNLDTTGMIVPVPIPEPATVASLMGIMVALVVLQKRLRSRQA